MNVRFGHQHWMHSIAPKSSYQCFTKIFVTWWTYGHNSNNNNDDEVCRRVHSSSGAVLMQTGVEEAKRAVSLWVDPASQLRAQKCSQFCFHWSPSFGDVWSDVDFSVSFTFTFLSSLFSIVLLKPLKQYNFKHKEKSEEKESKSSQLVTKKKHLQAKHLTKHLGTTVIVLMMRQSCWSGCSITLWSYVIKLKKKKNCENGKDGDKVVPVKLVKKPMGHSSR